MGRGRGESFLGRGKKIFFRGGRGKKNFLGRGKKNFLGGNIGGNIGMFPKIWGSSLCFPVPMFPGTYVPRYLCSPVNFFFTPPQKLFPP